MTTKFWFLIFLWEYGQIQKNFWQIFGKRVLCNLKGTINKVISHDFAICHKGYSAKL
jgi:hypothetical protein